MPNKITLTALCALAFSVAAFGKAYTPGHEMKTETAFARVIRNGALRCAYWTLEPLSYKDFHSGDMKGFAVDLTRELTKKLGVKVKWVEEVTFANMMEGLDANRYDAVCTGVWLSADRAHVMEYTIPYLFSAAVAVVRTEDHRFDADMARANDKTVRFCVHDNLAAALVEEMFPAAQRVQLPEMSSNTQVLLEVATGKADLTITDAADFQNYAVNNPGKLRLLHPDHPLRLYPWVIPVRKGEHELVSFINSALTEMVYNGAIEKITGKNGIPAGTYGYFKAPVAVQSSP